MSYACPRHQYIAELLSRFNAGHGEPVKPEFIHFDGVDIEQDDRADLVPVCPALIKLTCFITKLLANADRYNISEKDIFDLCMMRREWGPIP